MTPQEKAKGLVEKYLNKISTQGERHGLLTCEAKQCALIAVDEIIKEYGTYYKVPDSEGKYISYWQQVKEEINKL